MWLEVGETEDCMVEAVCKEPGCGWGRRDSGLYGGGSV